MALIVWKGPTNFQFARLACLNGVTADAPPLVYDPATGLFPSDGLSASDMEQLAKMENQLALPSVPGLTSRERVERLATAVKALSLSARATPAKPIRWIGPSGQMHVDLAQILTNEMAEKNQSHDPRN